MGENKLIFPDHLILEEQFNPWFNSISLEKIKERPSHNANETAKLNPGNTKRDELCMRKFL